MYKKPSEEMIALAMDYGWSKEEAERGYTIFNFDGTGLLEIEAIGDVFGNADDSYDVDDEDCAREAERSRFCTIIPVDELPSEMLYLGDNRRYYGWVDTPENRKNISLFFSNK